MIDDPANPFKGLPGVILPAQLLAMNKPWSESLAACIHTCSQDPATRSVATTALIISLWQLQGRSLGGEVPSLLIIRPPGETKCPVDDFVKCLVYSEEANRPSVPTSGPFTHLPIGLAPRMMANAVRARHALGHPCVSEFPWKQKEARSEEARFMAARTTAYGHGPSRPYSKAWHPEYDLLTEDDNRLILRLNDDEDRAGFRKDFLEDPTKILVPVGIGRDLAGSFKKISISGALTTEQWDSDLAKRVLLSYLPVFPVPHCGDTPIDEETVNHLRSFAHIWNHLRLPSVPASLQLPVCPWVQRYHVALRKRLAVLPVRLEFPILHTIHRLADVCELIVNAAGGEQLTRDQAVALCRDLFEHTLWGMAMGVASYGWFGIGTINGLESDGLKKQGIHLLKRLRREGPMTTTLVIKNCIRNKRDRDAVLEALVAGNLVRIDGREVGPTPFRSYVEGLHANQEFPCPENHWEALGGGSPSHAQA